MALVLENLGKVYINEKNYKAAYDVLLQANEIQRLASGIDPPSYAWSLNLLGFLFYNIGDYCKAEKYYLEALTIYEKQTHQFIPDYTDLLCNIGHLYYDIGEYDRSESYLIEALGITRDLVGENKLDYSLVLNHLGNLYSAIGDLQNAKKCYQQSCEIVKNILGERDLGYAIELLNLSTLYAVFKDTVNSEECLLKSWEILSERDSNNIAILATMGDYYNRKGDLSKAEKYYLQGLDISDNIKESQPFYRASLLIRIGRFYSEHNSHKAETYYVQALDYCKSTLGKQHPLYLIILNDIGRLYYSNKEYSKAEPYYTECLSLTKSLFVKSTYYLSERQRKDYWNRISISSYLQIPRFAYSFSIPKTRILAFNNELFKKGVLLYSSETIKHSIFASDDSVLIAQWNEFTNEKHIIMTMQEKNPRSPLIAEHQENADYLEKEIIKSSAEYRRNQKVWKITWDSVRNRLAPNQVAIEYMIAPIKEDSTMYCALLLRKNSKTPQMVPLFNESEVTNIVNTTTENQTSYTYSYNGNGNQLSQLVWSKILPYIKQGETVYFAPSGILHQLAIEALPYDENHTMGDMYNLVRLSSTREIVKRKDEVRQSSTATLYGGIQYNMDADELLTESEAYKATDLLASRGIESDTLNRGTITYLKGTKTEAENINAMLKQNNLQVQLFTAKNANEESFKALSGKHRNILHIATHGFYWSDSTAQKKDYFSQRMMMRLGNEVPTPPTIDPLNRCGLLFAGAQTAWSGHSADLPEGVQDGILTAKEISLLDLRDADLVVLSACETGRGEITGDGVFGLQRAFKQAGAQTIVMSLWPVKDAATQLLMTEFYRNWITNHQSKREAFRNAQNTVRAKYEEPVYWAGFIMLD